MEITIDMVIITVYLLVLLGIGFYASRKIKDSMDFSIAGRKIGFPILLGTLIGTSIGAASTMGKAGKAYEIGIALFFATMAYAVGLFIFGLIAPAIRRTGIWNIPDALFIRYGGGMRLAFAITMVLSVTALFGTQLIAVGLAITSMMGEFGISYTEAILGAGIVMVLYTMLGGLLAVAYTDFVQTIIMLAAVGILLPVFIVADLGSTTTVALLTPSADHFWGGLTAVYIVSIVLIDLPFSLIDPSLWQRAAAAKSSTTIRKSMFITSGVYVYWSFVVVFLGITASHLFPELGATKEGVDAAIPNLIVHYMPAGLKGLCLAAMMAIMMSTADTVLLIAGTSFSRDIFQALRPRTEDRTLLSIARGFILIIGVLGIVFALNMSGIFDLILLAFAIFVSGAFVPTIAALFWRRATKAGAIVSSATASLTVVALYGLKMAGMLPQWVEPIIISISLSFILMLGVSHMTYRPETATPRLIDLGEQVDL
ncbi:MAG: sodium:solute symporter family protein [bacterium]